MQKMEEKEARDWLVKNIKGLGYKEASHFMRNVGYKNLAILDRHIINVMHDYKVLKQKPKALTKKNYLEIETKFKKLSKQLNMSAAELDLYMWYMKAGEVLK
jgi:N-glycosylase/DNA lyase